jgi:hypothetical protein
MQTATTTLTAHVLARAAPVDCPTRVPAPTACPTRVVTPTDRPAPADCPTRVVARARVLAHWSAHVRAGSLRHLRRLVQVSFQRAARRG